MGTMKIIVNKTIDVLFHILKPNKNWAFFTSFHGQYNDNPKYISMKLHEEVPEAVIFWEIGEKSAKNDIPEYIHRLNRNTLRFYYIKNKCSVIVDNFSGYYTSSATGLKRYFTRLLKNKKQYNLSTGHGTAVKNVLIQDPESIITKEGFQTTSDICVTGSQLGKQLRETATANRIPVVMTGTPRTDILFNTDERIITALRKKLGLPCDKKILLYAPTWRRTPEDSGVIQLNQIDYSRLFQTLKDKFGGEWVFAFRLHNLALNAADVDQLKTRFGEDRFFNGNLFDDMMEYMASCDILISDYSSAIYDWALLKRPCFLYAHDRDEYENHGRGLYYTMEFFPYSFSNSFDELITNIKNFDELEFEKKRLDFLKKIGNVEDGHAAERAVELLKKRIYQ